MFSKSRLILAHHVPRLARLVVLAAALLGVVDGLYAPWYRIVYAYGGISSRYAENGWYGSGRPSVLMFILAGLLALLPLCNVHIRETFARLPRWINESSLLVGPGALAFIFTILFIHAKNRGVSVAGVSYGATFGAYCGVVLSMVVIAGGFLVRVEPGG